MILLIFASWVARFVGISYRCPAETIILKCTFRCNFKGRTLPLAFSRWFIFMVVLWSNNHWLWSQDLFVTLRNFVFCSYDDLSILKDLLYKRLENTWGMVGSLLTLPCAQYLEWFLVHVGMSHYAHLLELPNNHHSFHEFVFILFIFHKYFNIIMGSLSAQLYTEIEINHPLVSRHF
jgi:hypothetical protein